MRNSFFLVNLVLVLSSGYSYFLCTDSVRIEPTVGEIVSGVFDIFTDSPAELDQEAIQALSQKFKDGISSISSKTQVLDTIIDTSASTLKWINYLPIPLRTLVASGQFSIDLARSNKQFSFNDVYLIQQNYHTSNFVCSIAGIRNSMLGSIFCTCGSNQEDFRSAGQTRTGPSMPELDAHLSQNSQWCISVSPVCTSKSVGSNCLVSIDALRTSCIWVRQPLDLAKFHADQQNDNSNPLKSEQLPVTYSLVIPTVGSSLGSLLLDLYGSILGLAHKHVEGFLASPRVQPFAPYFSHLDALSRQGIALVNSFPVSLVAVLIGANLMVVADELAANAAFQFLFAGCGGLALFLAWVLYMLYRY